MASGYKQDVPWIKSWSSDNDLQQLIDASFLKRNPNAPAEMRSGSYWKQKAGIRDLSSERDFEQIYGQMMGYQAPAPVQEAPAAPPPSQPSPADYGAQNQPMEGGTPISREEALQASKDRFEDTYLVSLDNRAKVETLPPPPESKYAPEPFKPGVYEVGGDWATHPTNPNSPAAKAAAESDQANPYSAARESSSERPTETPEWDWDSWAKGAGDRMWGKVDEWGRQGQENLSDLGDRIKGLVDQNYGRVGDFLGRSEAGTGRAVGDTRSFVDSYTKDQRSFIDSQVANSTKNNPTKKSSSYSFSADYSPSGQRYAGSIWGGL
jgi:hypothetical protein